MFSFGPRLAIRFDAPKGAVKRKARWLTLVAALLVGVSGPFLILYKTSKEIPALAELVWMPYLCWGVHVTVILFAAILWIFEKPADIRGRCGKD